MESGHPKVWRSDAVLPVTHMFSVTEGATGVIHSAKRVAYANRDAFKNELERQVEHGILLPVDGPTEWVNSMVMAEKKNVGLRICIGLCDLNKVIKHKHYQIPTKE